jgi:GTP pyrophosphokinase
MVQVTDKFKLTAAGLIDVSAWFDMLQSFYPKERFAVIASAYDLALEVGVDHPGEYGGNVFQHGVEVAAILFDLQADEEAVAAGLLLGVSEANLVDTSHISERCGEPVSKILMGVRNMVMMRTLQNVDPNKAQIDKFRKMLLTLVEDVRIVLVKLAERVCLMRAVRKWTESYKQVFAKEILDIYAPLANRLGLIQIKWELEDRAFFYLYPVEYKKIAKQLKLKRLEREQYIKEAVLKINVSLVQHSIEALISGRVKHIYSIWRKTRNKDIAFDELFDIRAIRVLVSNVDECYEVLSVLNDLWVSLPEEFSDYIATPKSNGYQSVHAVYLGPDSLPIEVQIRTHDMHETSEMGVAAHWRYKEAVKYDAGYETRIAWLRSLMEWQDEMLEVNSTALDKVHTQLVDERVYAFTPNGDVQDLPKGSTVLDFAYHVHTMVGHRCRGAKINGRIMPLSTKLTTGDKVDILTHRTPQPSKDWYNASSGYVFSNKIRARILRWFKLQNKEENARLGKERLLPEVRSLSVAQVDYLVVAGHFNMVDEESFYAAIETGDLRFNQVANYISEKFQVKDRPRPMQLDADIPYAEDKKYKNKGNLTIYGVDNLLSHMAGCCKPVAGDEIVGFVTQGRGVTVHRQSCHNYQKLRLKHPEKMVEVTWRSDDSHRYPVDILVSSREKEGFPSDVFSVLSADKVVVLGSKTDKKETSQFSIVRIKIAIESVIRLQEICKHIKSVKGVETVERTY